MFQISQIVVWFEEIIFGVTLFCFPPCLMELGDKYLDDMKYNIVDQILTYKGMLLFYYRTQYPIYITV